MITLYIYRLALTLSRGIILQFRCPLRSGQWLGLQHPGPISTHLEEVAHGGKSRHGSAGSGLYMTVRLRRPVAPDIASRSVSQPGLPARELPQWATVSASTKPGLEISQLWVRMGI